MKLYIENPKDSTRKLLAFINEFSKASGYKINTWKSVAFLYTNNKTSGREIKKTIPFTTASKRIKYLGINLPNKQKTCSLKTMPLLDETEDDTNKWKDIPCSWIGRINTVKMTILPRAINRFDAIPIKLPKAFFTKLKQKYLKFVSKYRRIESPEMNPALTVHLSLLEKEITTHSSILAWKKDNRA